MTIACKWLQIHRSENGPINGQILREKGFDVAKQLGIETFQSPYGYLHAWKARHSLSFRDVSNESNLVTQEMTRCSEETSLPTILPRFHLKDIYNADEFGLFYQGLPNKTLHRKGEKCSGGKYSKVRLIGMTATSATGEKPPLVVIGKSKKLRCFNGEKNLPCRYRAQAKSWMDSFLFEECVKEVDKRFARKDRKVAFIIDHCPAQTKIEGLKLWS